ncbi:LysR substrate-binding domain-containing protein, partial [Roseomonas mucosa]|uniref:LysR substrate-binding domain-containing protein n=2 Tax=Roseomonas mucosa TaxID=207340 RepID=UPI0028CF740E
GKVRRPAAKASRATRTADFVMLRIENLASRTRPSQRCPQSEGFNRAKRVLRNHDLVEFPNSDGRGVAWTFRKADCTVEHRQDPRFTVNCALTIQRLLLNGAGIGVSSGYLCVPEIAAGKMVRLFEDWSLPSVPVHAVFPSHRERSSAVRVFLDFLRETCWDGHQWQFDPLALRSTSRGGCSEAGQR